ncbi:unnamed protein product [Caenorhabditis sp. 36 PRJEB53466]|nr:unnamed protein product [Caenorhabditis sp. 36 PRJEB53466]
MTEHIGCYSCFIRHLESSANLFGYTLRPICQFQTNLSPEYHLFFRSLTVECHTKIERRVWESLQLDRITYETTLRALTQELDKLMQVGVLPQTADGTRRVITLMSGIKNLILFLNSIKDD